MAANAKDALFEALFEGRISRQTFMRQAAALGLSASAVASVLGTGQDAAAANGTATRPKSLPRASSERSKTVIFDIDSGRVLAPTLFNPFVPGMQTDAGFNQAMMEPLFIFNYGTGTIDPWLGLSYSFNKSLDVWTLKLRQGIMWSDGQAFNADDVVFTFEMLRTGPATLTWASFVQQWIKSVKKIDDYTVQFNLKAPNPRFALNFLTVVIYNNIYIVPEHIWKGQDPEKFQFYDAAKGWPLGTGPYKLVTATPTEFLWQLDPNWWGAKAGFKSLPAPQKLQFVSNDTEDVRVARAAQHQLDSVMDITAGGWLALKARNPNMMAFYPNLPYAWADPCPRQLSFNTRVAPWNDPDMRVAVSYAIDRDQIVSIAYEGTSKPNNFVYPAYPVLNKYVAMLTAAGVFNKYPITSHNVAKAKQIIESKGYKIGGDGYYYDAKKNMLALDILTDSPYTELKRVSQVVVQQLQNIGINAGMPIIADVTWTNDQLLGQFAAAMNWWSCGSVAEPWTSLDVYTNKWWAPIGKQASHNEARWNNKHYSSLVDAMGKLVPTDPKVKNLFLSAGSIFVSQLPVVPLTQAKKLVPFDTTYWTGWPSAKNYYGNPATWWQTTHVIIHNLKPTGR
jgi:peptide/nickel transport system substrate-binding protein